MMSSRILAPPLFLFLCVVLGFVPFAHGSEPTGPRSTYTGAFAGVRVETAATYPLPGSAQDGLGLSAGLGGRFATIVQVLDLEGMYRFHRYEVSEQVVGQHRLEVNVRLHPLLMSHLGSTRRSYIRGGVHLLGGLGVAWDRADSGDSFSPIVQLGLGFDLPLNSPDAPSGWWLGLSWRAALGFAEVTGARENTGHHLFMLSLEFRVHTLNFMNLP